VYRRLRFSNFLARAYPERLSALADVLLSQHARIAETNILDKLSTSSVPVTSVQVLGAARDLLPYYSQLATNYRGRHRIDPVAPLTVLLPWYARDMIRADLSRSVPGDETLSVSDAEIQGYFTSAHLDVTWYQDARTGSGQDAEGQSAGDVADFPHNIGSISAVEGFLFAPGSFIFLDGGALDLGLIRDSVLNNTNDAELFAETFEGIAFVGLESVRFRSNVCPSGTSSQTSSAAAVCTAS
jgi:hypothetical protein